MIVKRIFDIISSLLGLLILGPILLLMSSGAAMDTKSNGVFRQLRIGQHGTLFRIYKLRSIHFKTQSISNFGKFLRNSKIDEIPQLINILLGQMSFVGPRPDIPGYADRLVGEDRLLLSLKPGLTGLASLKYRKEEELLAQQPNPLHYNDTVIWPDKVRLNNWYAQHRTFKMDVMILFYTFLPFLPFEPDQFIENYKKS